MPPKKRNKENCELPRRWLWKHGAIYYVTTEDDRELFDNKKWFRLGKTISEAHSTFSERMKPISGDAIFVEDILDKFEFLYLPKLAKRTQKYYLHALPILRQVFTTNKVYARLVKPTHAYKMMKYVEEEHNSKRARQCMECLSSAFSFAVKEGDLDTNPFIGQVKKPAANARTHEVPDTDLLNFGLTLDRKWQLYLNLKLRCKGRRKGELLRLMRSDICEQGLRFVNNKRKDDVFYVGWNNELRAIVNEIIEVHPNRVGDAPLFFTRQFKPYIDDDGLTDAFDSMWQRKMTKAVKDGICNHFTEHDIRQKANENEDLERAAHFLRHTSKETARKHYPVKPEII